MDAKSKSLLVTLPSGKQGFRRGAIVFTDGGGVSDFVIRMAQGWRGYTHCGIALGDGKMIAAWGAAGKVVLQDDLQQMTTEARMMPGDSQIIDWSVVAAMTALGDPYDFAGLFGCIGLPAFGKGPPDAFTCSSLVAARTLVGLHITKPMRFVLPQDVWEVVK